MEYNYKIFLFLLLGTTSFILERRSKSGCNETYYTLLISFLHNLGSIYIVFGSLLFGYYLLHLLICIGVVVLWHFTNTCIITMYYNQLCNLKRDRPFHDIFYMINKTMKIPYLRYIIIIIVSLYDIKNILRLNFSSNLLKL